MKTILAGITAAWISCQLAFRVCAQPTTAFSQPLTYTEQTRQLGLMISKAQAPSRLLINSADYHIAQAKTLLQIMDDTKPTPPVRTLGYRLIKPIVFHLEKARQAGVSYESSLNEIYRNSSRATALIRIRKESLLNDMKAAGQLGLLTPENMQRLEQVLAPVVTKGNPRYVGDIVEVHHRALYSLSSKYENEVANLQLLPQSLHDEKWVHELELSNEHETRLNKLYWADKNAITGGIIGSGIGLALLYTSGNALRADLNAPHDDFTSKLRIGENASLFVSGGAMTAVGISEIGSRFARSDTALSSFSGVTKWGGRATLAGVIIAEVIALRIDYENWDKMRTSQHIGSMVQHGINIGTGVYAMSRAAQTLVAGSALAVEEDAAGGGPIDIPNDFVAGGIFVGTVLVAGCQYAYDYFHPIQPGWNSFAFSGLSPDRKRHVEDLIYHNYSVTR